MLDELKSFYIIGIGGISMSAIARILKQRGYKICGSDIHNSELIEELRREGIDIVIGDSQSFVISCDALILTGAISSDNVDVLLAKKVNKPIFTRAEILGEITKNYKVISIAGTHGKTTTTGMIASMLLNASLDPTIHIGGILNNIGSNLYLGTSEYFVTEACEYKDSFLSLSSYISIILNIQEDHLDYFKDLDNIYHSFNRFADNTIENGLIIYNNDGVDERLILNKNTMTFGIDNKSNVQARNIEEYSAGKFKFDLFYNDKFLVNIFLPCFGYHNVFNALASSACGIFLGLEPDKIKKGVEAFEGIKRRNEIIYETGDNLIIHDYAHHPTEIASTIKAYRKINRDGKLVAIFQPHTFTRTKALFDQFVKCFDGVDEVWLVPIYPAREKPIKGITSYALAKQIQKSGKRARYFSSFSKCKKAILENMDNVNIFAILGAGDIETLAYSLKEINPIN